MLEDNAQPTRGFCEDINYPCIEEREPILSRSLSAIQDDDWTAFFVMSLVDPVTLFEGMSVVLVEMIQRLLEPLFGELRVVRLIRIQRLD